MELSAGLLVVSWFSLWRQQSMASRIAVKDPDNTYLWKINQQAMCSVCLNQNAAWYEVHHIIKNGRSDENCNYLLVCETCHRVIEGHRVWNEYLRAYYPSLKLANVLWCKAERAPGEHNPVRLQELHPQALPEMERLPDWYFRLSSTYDRFSVFRKHDQPPIDD